MELDIISLRKKQRIRYLALLSIVILFISATVIGLIYFLPDPQVEKDDEGGEITEETDETIVCFSNDVDEALQEKLRDVIKTKVSTAQFQLSSDVSDCDIAVVRNLNVDSRFIPLWSKTYILTARKGVDAPEIVKGSFEDGIQSQSIGGMNIIWSSETDSFIKSRFNTISGQQYTTDLKVIERMHSADEIGIIPFNLYQESLDFVAIESNSPHNKDYDENSYPLVDRYWLYNSSEEIITNDEIVSATTEQLGGSNYDSSKLHDILFTGSSALYSIYASQTQPTGGQYVSPDLQNLLSISDLHIAHEDSAYFDSCTYSLGNSYICGKPEQLDLYRQLGVDAIGVSGNNILDYGRDSYSQYLGELNSLEIQYFGGGGNSTEAIKPTYLQMGDQKVAVIGFNLATPITYYATAGLPGRANPNYALGDARYVRESIADAKDEGAEVVIVQYNWADKSCAASTVCTSQIERIYAQVALDSGADIVLGIAPENLGEIEEYKEKKIFYSLGKFAYEGSLDGQLHGVLLRVTYYDGLYFGFELLPLTRSAGILSVSEDRQLLQPIYSEELINQLASK